MKTRFPLLYHVGRWALKGALGFYFSRIEKFHLERVPAAGPLLLASNHPNSLTDAFVIGTALNRKVNFVATVGLFSWRPVRWLLSRCGVIPINRVKDDPRAMRTVLGSFEACYRVLEQGEAVGIFPEGVTRDEPHLQPVKTGLARMALELEHRHHGQLGLKILPVGLTFPAKGAYRATALLNVGEPIAVTDYLEGYPERRHECVQKLTAEVERKLQALIVHIPHLERARLVEAVKRLYLGRLRVGTRIIREPVPPETGELQLTQAIAAAVERTCELHPERAAEFTHRLDRYERWLRRLRLPEDVLGHFPQTERMLLSSVGWMAIGILGAPVAVYGWAHRFIPWLAIRAVVKRSQTRPGEKTHISTATVLTGIVVFTTFYAACALVFHHFFGWYATFWYALSLPVTSLVAYYYTREMRRFVASLRATAILLRAPSAARALLRERERLTFMIETEQHEIEAARAATT